jgi:hypothetical protein
MLCRDGSNSKIASVLSPHKGCLIEAVERAVIVGKKLGADVTDDASLRSSLGNHKLCRSWVKHQAKPQSVT